jgi:hypothetical protein
MKDNLRAFADKHGISILEVDVGQNLEPFMTMDMTKTKLAVQHALGKATLSLALLLSSI